MDFEPSQKRRQLRRKPSAKRRQVPANTQGGQVIFETLMLFFFLFFLFSFLHFRMLDHQTKTKKFRFPKAQYEKKL